MPRRKKSDLEIKQVKKIKLPRLLNGFKDGLPMDARHWLYVREQILEIAQDYSFQFIDTPIIERLELYSHTLGKNSAAIQKAFKFILKREHLILRPDFIPGLARAYIEHNFKSQGNLTKLFSVGKIFRQDENEYFGNLRQINELVLEVFGNKSANAEAELIFIIYHLFQRLKAEVLVELNSMGCLECFDAYQKALRAYYRSKRQGLCVKCKRSLAKKDIFQILRCSNVRCQKLRSEAPPIVDWLCKDCKDHFFKVIEALDDLKVPYQLNPWLMKEFAYQKRTIFEIRFFDKTKEDNRGALLARGSRHDNLVEMLSGEPTPAVGICLILEKIVRLLRENKIEPPEKKEIDIYFAQLAEAAKRKAMVLFEELRHQGYIVKANFTQDSLKSQLEQAKKAKAKIVFILAQKELMEGTIIMRDMEGGTQEVINLNKINEIIKKRFKALKYKR